MKIEKIVLILIISVILTVGCATVKENKEKNAELEKTEQAEETEDLLDANNPFLKIPSEELDKFAEMMDDSTMSEMEKYAIYVNFMTTYKDVIDEANSLIRNDNNQSCKSEIFVYPSSITTSTSATINVNMKKIMGWEDTDNVYFGFKYKLIFDEKIIYENDNRNCSGKEIIPAHSIQKEGIYIVAYEVYFDNAEGGDHTYCQGTVQFIVK